MMNLNETAEPARVMKRGYQHNVAVASGQSIVIETSPGGVEVLDVECPAGKAWTVSFNVSIMEVNA